MLVLGQALLLAAAPPAPPAPVASTPLILDANRADRAPAPGTPPPAEQPGGAGATRVEATPSGAPIRHIGFGGMRVPAPVAAAARRFIGRPADRATLEALAKAMADAYAESDVALYTVVVPAQRLDGGDVRILVAEGHVERVAFKRGRTPLLAAYAAALARETPLTRRTMERYLSLMRDVPGRTVDVQLLRGATPGGVILQIDARAKRKDLTLTFDNRGTSLLGQGQARLDGHAYSLLRDGDRTDLTGLVSPDFHRLRYVSLAHATPLGASGATVGASAGYIATHPRHSIVDGEARTFGLAAALPVIRGYKRNLTLTLGLDGIDSDAAALGNVLSSDHTRAVRLAAGYSYAGAKSVLTAGATLSRGLDILGAKGPAGFTDIVFTKLNGRVGYDRTIGKHFVGRVRAAGQYSPDRLAAAERFAVGGADFGRAFDAALLSGDCGYAGAGELAWRPKLPAKLAGSEVYGFVDGARDDRGARPLSRGPLRSRLGRCGAARVVRPARVARARGGASDRSALSGLAGWLADQFRLAARARQALSARLARPKSVASAAGDPPAGSRDMDRIFTAISTRVAAFAGQPAAFVGAVALILLWGVLGPVFHYSDTWQLVVNTATTIVTFLMVFLIQNSQNRDGAAMQAKLDELIRAIDNARGQFIGIEHMTDREISRIRSELEHECRDADEKAPGKQPSPAYLDRLIKRR